MRSFNYLNHSNTINMAKKEASGFARANRFIRHNIFKKLRKMPEFRAAFNLDSQDLAAFKGRSRYNKEYQRWAKQLQNPNAAMWDKEGKLVSFLDDASSDLHNAWYTQGKGTNSSFYRNSQLSVINDPRRYLRNIPDKAKMPSVMAHETGHSILDSAPWDEQLDLRNAIFKKYKHLLTPDQLQAVRDYNRRKASAILGISNPTPQQVRDYFANHPDADEIVPDIVSTLIPTPKTENISNALFRHYEKYVKTFIDPVTGQRKVYYDLKTAPKEARLRLLDRVLPRDNSRYADRKPIVHNRSPEQSQYYDWVRDIFPRGLDYKKYSPAEREAKRTLWLQSLLSGKHNMPPLNRATEGVEGVKIPVTSDSWAQLQEMFPSIFDIH